MRNGKLYLVLLLWAVIIHVILVGLSFLEVAIYSYLVNPGQDIKVYESHALRSAPYVSIIAGFLIIFLVAMRLIRRNREQQTRTGLLLPVFYIVLDLAMLAGMGTDWQKYYPVLLISFVTKMLAGYLAIVWSRRKN